MDGCSYHFFHQSHGVKKYAFYSRILWRQNVHQRNTLLFLSKAKALLLLAVARCFLPIFFEQIVLLLCFVKVAGWKKCLYLLDLVYMFSPYSKFEFSFLSLCVYLFKNCPQFLSHWESAEPVFCSEELSM